MTKPTAWTDAENRAIVALYFAMLDRALSGQSYNKAAMIRAAQGVEPDAAALTPADAPYAPLAGRSKGSIEAKLLNVTACLHSLGNGYETISLHDHGYKALNNYQAALKDAVRAYFLDRASA